MTYVESFSLLRRFSSRDRAEPGHRQRPRHRRRRVHVPADDVGRAAAQAGPHRPAAPDSPRRQGRDRRQVRRRRRARVRRDGQPGADDLVEGQGTAAVRQGLDADAGAGHPPPGRRVYLRGEQRRRGPRRCQDCP